MMDGLFPGNGMDYTTTRRTTADTMTMTDIGRPLDEFKKVEGDLFSLYLKGEDHLEVSEDSEATSRPEP